MYSNWLANAAVVSVSLLSLLLVVVVHYEGLVRFSQHYARRNSNPKLRRRIVLAGIGAVFALHVIEMWIFSLALWLLLLWPECGALSGHGASSLLDVVYFSAMTYTTAGTGDLAPVGPVRFTAGVIALTGFLMITWSASFTFLEMERFWRKGKSDGD